MPAQELRMIPITWPFAVWGLDMVGPFKRSKDKKTHLLVAVDKFTKWVEAEPVSKCDAEHPTDITMSRVRSASDTCDTLITHKY